MHRIGHPITTLLTSSDGARSHAGLTVHRRSVGCLFRPRRTSTSGSASCSPGGRAASSCVVVRAAPDPDPPGGSPVRLPHSRAWVLTAAVGAPWTSRSCGQPTMSIRAPVPSPGRTNDTTGTAPGGCSRGLRHHCSVASGSSVRAGSTARCFAHEPVRWAGPGWHPCLMDQADGLFYIDGEEPGFNARTEDGVQGLSDLDIDDLLTPADLAGDRADLAAAPPGVAARRAPGPRRDASLAPTRQEKTSTAGPGRQMPYTREDRRLCPVERDVADGPER